MYCRNNTGSASHVLCREVYYIVSLFGIVHYQRSTVYSSAEVHWALISEGPAGWTWCSCT